MALTFCKSPCSLQLFSVRIMNIIVQENLVRICLIHSNDDEFHCLGLGLNLGLGLGLLYEKAAKIISIVLTQIAY